MNVVFQAGRDTWTPVTLQSSRTRRTCFWIDRSKCSIVSILFVTAISKKEEEEGAEEEGEEDDEEERRRRRRLIFKCVVFLCDYCSIIISKQIDTELISEIIHITN